MNDEERREILDKLSNELNELGLYDSVEFVEISSEDMKKAMIEPVKLDILRSPEPCKGCGTIEYSANDSIWYCEPCWRKMDNMEKLRALGNNVRWATPEEAKAASKEIIERYGDTFKRLARND